MSTTLVSNNKIFTTGSNKPISVNLDPQIGTSSSSSSSSSSALTSFSLKVPPTPSPTLNTSLPVQKTPSTTFKSMDYKTIITNCREKVTPNQTIVSSSPGGNTSKPNILIDQKQNHQLNSMDASTNSMAIETNENDKVIEELLTNAVSQVVSQAKDKETVKSNPVKEPAFPPFPKIDTSAPAVSTTTSKETEAINAMEIEDIAIEKEIEEDIVIEKKQIQAINAMEIQDIAVEKEIEEEIVIEKKQIQAIDAMEIEDIALEKVPAPTATSTSSNKSITVPDESLVMAPIVAPPKATPCKKRPPPAATSTDTTTINISVDVANNSCWDLLASKPKKRKTNNHDGFQAHPVGACQTHRSFSTEPNHLDFRYCSSSTSLRNRLLLYAIKSANKLPMAVEKVSRSIQAPLVSMFPPEKVSKLTIFYPERPSVTFFHDATIFQELSTRYELLGNNEQVLALSLSMVSSFMQWDEMAFNRDKKKMKTYKAALEQEYHVLASHLEMKPTKDFAHAPALECSLLAHLKVSRSLKRPPALPTLIGNLYEQLQDKYETVLNNEENWWEQEEEEEMEEEYYY